MNFEFSAVSVDTTNPILKVIINCDQSKALI